MALLTEKNLSKRSGFEDKSEITSFMLMKSVTPYTSTTSSGPYSSQVDQYVRSYVGWNVPRFHERLRAGELIPFTPWDQYGLFGSVEGYMDVYVISGGKSTHYWYDPQVPTNVLWLDKDSIVSEYCPSIYDEYVQEAAAAIYSNSHDTLTFIAELHEVKGLFTNVVKKILRLDFPKNWKSMSSEWLAGRYGWRTLIYDLQDLSDALARLDEKRTRYSERRGTKYSFEFSDVVTVEEAHYWMEHSFTDKVTVSLRGSVAADLTLPTFAFNPLMTGWELIRFSFILDWIVTVGKAIAAGSFLALQYNYCAASGYRVDVERTYHAEIGDTKATYISGSKVSNGEMYGYVERRTPCRVPLLPRLALRLNYLKVMDLVALIVQAKSRR